MPVPTGSLLDTQSTRIEEILSESIDVILPGLDPIWEGSIVTAQNVGPADKIGRDWEIHKLYMGGFTGVIDAGRPKADFPLAGDDTDALGDKLYLQNLVQTFPDPMESPNPQPYRLSIPLRSMVMNIPFTAGELVAEANRGLIGEVVAPKVAGYVQNIGHHVSTYFYLSQNSFYALCATASSSATTTETWGWSWTFQPSNLAIDRFAPGQRVDLWDSTGTLRRNEDASGNRINVYVIAVDELTPYVKLGTTANPNTWAWHYGSSSSSAPAAYDPSANDGDLVTFPNTSHASGSFTGIAGMNSWMKFGDASGSTATNLNTLLGTAESISGAQINVNVHPEFRSLLRNLSSTSLDDLTLYQIIARYNAAKRKYGHEIDTFIASEGVWLDYYANSIRRAEVGTGAGVTERWDRTGRAGSLSGDGLTGIDGWNFTFEGRTYSMKTSTYVESNTVYGIKLRGNWMRYVPPDPASIGSMSGVHPGVPFRLVGPILTGGSNRLPIYDTSGNRNLVTEGTQMPGWLRMNLVPDQVTGIKITNVNEDRLWGQLDS